MAIREIITQGDPRLAKKCHAVTEFGQRLWDLLDDMRDTLIESKGVGLAAPQIGIMRRVVLVINDEDEIMELINPEIIATSGEQTGLEGCLSVPGIHEKVTRPTSITINYFDENFVEHTDTYDGFFARIVQHEYDHLEGHVFTDRVSPMRRQMIGGKLQNIQKGKVRCSYKTK